MMRSYDYAFVEAAFSSGPMACKTPGAVSAEHIAPLQAGPAPAKCMHGCPGLLQSLCGLRYQVPISCRGYADQVCKRSASLQTGA